MAKLRFTITTSLDGYVAGPNTSLEHPLGEGADHIHDWATDLRYFLEMHGGQGGETGVDDDILRANFHNVGATIMGRNMFGGEPGPWGDEPWNGWWGPNPPFHHPVFVLTHHAREPQPMDGGTTFHFVTDGIEAALEQAWAAAGGEDVAIGGGANVAQQYLTAGLVDEMELHIVPILLGAGERLFDNIDTSRLRLEQVRTIEGKGVTHIAYRGHRSGK
jgi:dihydrofolate reductase